MKYLKTIAAGCTALFSMAAAASASAATIDFETLSDGVTTPTFLAGGSLPDHTPFLVGAEYAGLGVTFSSEGDSDDELGPVFGRLSGFVTDNIIIQDYKRDTTTGSTFNIRADFSEVVSSVSANVYAPTGDSVTMSAYDSSGALLGAVTSVAIAMIGEFDTVSLNGIGPIAYVIWESGSAFSSSVGIDNLMFETSEVPLPAALPLFIAGLAGMGAASKRKKAKGAA